MQQGSLEKSKFWWVPIFKGEPMDIFLRGTWNLMGYLGTLKTTCSIIITKYQWWFTIICWLLADKRVSSFNINHVLNLKLNWWKNGSNFYQSSFHFEIYCQCVLGISPPIIKPCFILVNCFFILISRKKYLAYRTSYINLSCMQLISKIWIFG